jgi:hypothetical protein
VLALISFFLDICLLRRAPQDLPASATLFWLVLAADLLAGLLLGLIAGLGFGMGLLQGAIELGLLLGVLAAGLHLTGHPRRFIQSATALLGTSVILSFIATIPLSLAPAGDQQSDLATLAAFGLLVLIAWSVVVNGHIIRHSFGIRLSQGVMIAIAFEVMTIWVMGDLFGGT